MQATNVKTHCGSIPPTATSTSGTIDQCGSDLAQIVAGSLGDDLGAKLIQMTAAYKGLAALQQLQQHSLTSSTAVGGLRQLYNDLVT